MISRFSIHALGPVSPPLALYVVFLLIPRWMPGFDEGAAQTWFRALPWVLLAASALLGLCFTQSRIALSGLVMAAGIYALQRGAAVDDNARLIAAIRTLSIIVVPSVTATLYRLNERGLFTLHGGLRLTIAASGALLLAALPHAPELVEALLPNATRTLGGAVRLPRLVLLVPMLCIPLVVIRKPHESPWLGWLLGVAMLFYVTAMNFDLPLWQASSREGAFLLFMSGCSFTLIWAVLECAWRSATLDELTQLPGRRALKNHLARLGASYTIAILDIDHFKQINDRHGHDVGDQVLRFIAAYLDRASPGTVYRFGGEEFVIICEGDDHQGHIADIEEVRRDIGEAKFRVRGKGRPKQKPEAPPPEKQARAHMLTITASVGVAGCDLRESTPADVMKAADEALYRAKRAGRNRLSKKGIGR